MKPIETILGVIAACAVLLMMSVTVIDVIGRSFLGRPLAGATVLTELAMLGMVFALYPVIALRRKHIVVDLFDPLIHSRWIKKLQEIVSSGLGIVLFGALGWQTWKTAFRQLRRGETTVSFEIPLAWLSFFMSVLAWMTAAAFLLLLIDTLFRNRIEADSSVLEGDK